jgi:hypothetical protein
MEAMARGFESKSVEFQQEEAARGKRPAGPPMTPAERADNERRKTLGLALARATDDLRRATVPAHRRMLEQALAALQAQIDELGRGRREHILLP